MLAALMLCVKTRLDRTYVSVQLDFLGMDEHAKVLLFFKITCLRRVVYARCCIAARNASYGILESI